MGTYEDEQAQAKNTAQLVELHDRNPLRTSAAAQKWCELRDAVEAVRANTDGAIERLVDAFGEFVKQYAIDHPDAPSLQGHA